jgi:small subunit ribosomal protein S35
MFRFTRAFSRSATVLSDIALTPKKWLGLPPQEIIRLSKVRRATLGGKFTHDSDELAALLTTSTHTGVSKRDIKILYQKGEVGAYQVEGVKFEDDHTPLPFEYDEYPEAAQQIIRDHREQREYNRIAAYEMPHLVKYRQKYEPAAKGEKPITYKYTTYLGEPEYAANRKVRLTVKVSDLGLDEQQAHKFKVLAGARYDSNTDVFKTSTDRFEEPLQNTRFLSDTLNSLLSESKDLSKESFSDIPLDTRHTAKRLSKAKIRQRRYRSLAFPESWKRPQDAPKTGKTVLDYVKDLEAEKNA